MIDPFKVIYFLENHPRFSITKASCYMSAVVIILEAVLLFHRPEGWLATVSFFSAIAFNLLAFFIPDWLLHHKLASICRQSKTIYSDNIP